MRLIKDRIVFKQTYVLKRLKFPDDAFRTQKEQVFPFRFALPPNIVPSFHVQCYDVWSIQYYINLFKVKEPLSQIYILPSVFPQFKSPAIKRSGKYLVKQLIGGAMEGSLSIRLPT